MSTTYVPQQQPDEETPPEVLPIQPHASEATRQLCAGVYVDPHYRDRVIEELYLNEQRIVAPSLGFDAARVLAHALRARRQELIWSGAIIGLWVVGIPLSRFLLAGLLWPGMLFVLARWIRGRDERPSPLRRVIALCFLWNARFAFLTFVVLMVITALGGGPAEPWQAWAGIGVLALIALCSAAQRNQFVDELVPVLSRQRFPDIADDPAEKTEGQRFRRLMHRIRLEQHASLIMYDEARPFCGAGVAQDTWVLAVELRPDEEKRRQPLSNRTVLDRIKPLLEQLRVPPEYAGPGVRDRLRRLEIDECVFLPVEGLLSRDQTPYTPQEFDRHRERAVEEGGEKRRHFLRVRVGGWEEELVVTVFVRVHTQGGMLMLEIAPHVLNPVRADFKDAHRASHRFRNNTPLGKAATAVALVPGSVSRSLGVLGRGAAHGWRLLTGGDAGALPEGPAVSVRELASVSGGSIFQEMDVARYLRSIQDRIANGVRLALADAGYETGEFVQKIVNISDGAVHIGRVEGSTFAVGPHARATATNGGSAVHNPRNPQPTQPTEQKEPTKTTQSAEVAEPTNPQNLPSEPRSSENLQKLQNPHNSQRGSDLDGTR